MMCPQKFGGNWTEKKLQAIEHYLQAYLSIFTSNPQAAKLTRHYVDAFAGSGLREIATPTSGLLSKDAIEAVQYMDGSVCKVLSLDKSFHHYWFVEKNARHANDLEEMIKTDFPDRAERCTVERGDANEFLLRWAANLTAKDRAVVFLDPYGTAVEWPTLELLGATKKVDLWMLFPCSGVIRMLPNSGPPDQAWANRLTSLFGTAAWRDEFYPTTQRDDLFGSVEETRRQVSPERVADFFLRRLGEVFAEVAPKPLVLYNSRRSPLFHLVFAAANPRGAKAAIRIANHLIGRT